MLNFSSKDHTPQTHARPKNFHTLQMPMLKGGKAKKRKSQLNKRKTSEKEEKTSKESCRRGKRKLMVTRNGRNLCG